MNTARTVAQWAALAALSAVIAAAGVYGGLYASNPSPRTAPAFALPNAITQDTLALSDLAGSPVLLFFFDAGSMRSLSAIPYVSEWHRRYEGDGLKVVGIHWSRFEPMKTRDNMLESTYRRKATFPVVLDSAGSVYAAYSVAGQPAYVLLSGGLEIVMETSAGKPYAEVETAIQQLLAASRPDIKIPFLVKPLSPTDDPAKKILPATAEILLGYLGGAIVGCDSAARDTFYNYADAMARDRAKVYLQGYWKVGPDFVSHAHRLRSSGDYLRVIYSGKEVWILPSFAYDSPQRVYIKQDRVYPDKAIWGKDIYGDEVGLPYIRMKYSAPVHVISNRSFGSHELQLIPAEGDVAFYCIYFEDGVAE